MTLRWNSCTKAPLTVQIGISRLWPINLLLSYVTTITAENFTELIRLDRDTAVTFSSGPLFFSTKVHLFAEARLLWSVKQTIMWLTLSFSSDPTVPSFESHCVFLASLSLLLSQGLFLSVSYDVLRSWSGSRTVTLLSLCHLICAPFLVTWTAPAYLNACVCVCVSIIVWP